MRDCVMRACPWPPSFFQEKQKLLDEIEELSVRLSNEQENRRKLGDRLSHERHQFQRDKEATQEVSRGCPLGCWDHPEALRPG